MHTDGVEERGAEADADPRPAITRPDNRPLDLAMIISGNLQD